MKNCRFHLTLKVIYLFVKLPWEHKLNKRRRFDSFSLEFFNEMSTDEVIDSII